MKTFFYKIFALVFNICRIAPVKNGRVCLVSPHSEGFNDSLGAIEQELKSRGGFEIFRISSPRRFSLRFFTVDAYRLAVAQYIILNDNFMPMAEMRISQSSTVVQLWHAEGAFKRFGQSLKLPEKIAKRAQAGNSRLNWVICSSEQVVPIYAEAFGVPETKVLPLGSPRTDYFFSAPCLADIRKEFDGLYPQAKGKKLVLYAPTFRDNHEDDRQIFSDFDAARLLRELGEGYALLIRLHPQIRSASPPAAAINVTSHPDIRILAQVCDSLITDYSSVCMEFVLLNKPCVFYARDLEKYNADRPFYFDYEQYVPGEIAKTMDELISAVKNNGRGFEEKLKQFCRFNFGSNPGGSAKRVVDFLCR